MKGENETEVRKQSTCKQGKRKTKKKKERIKKENVTPKRRNRERQKEGNHIDKNRRWILYSLSVRGPEFQLLWYLKVRYRVCKCWALPPAT
jgi:hypothetical protein